MDSLRILALGIAVAAAAVVSPVGNADDTAIRADAAQGAVVIRDNETGELRAPTAAEALRYRDEKTSARPGADEQRLVRRADGSESLRLDGRYTTFVTVQRNADGDWEESCRQDHDHEAAHAASKKVDAGRAVR